MPVRETELGKAVDVKGGPVIDPTANVIALNEAANKRQDDLRQAERRLAEKDFEHMSEMAALRNEHIKETMDLRARHAEALGAAESKRLDAIRQVDVTAVRTEADRALAAIQTLAATTAVNAETLRTALTNTATTIAKQTSDTVGQLIERIAALEKSSYEGVGKQRLADPQLLDLIQQVKSLAESRSTGTGKSEGGSSAWTAMLAVLGAFGTVFGIIGVGALLLRGH